ncbi:Replication factor A protein 1 [Saitozyma podzolica]|uniref:Replication protein A subunit n=1 Tax=Saitozyma podzolica TaxID=1890683 RepID=A0A427YDT3_9TREE|nr:Replication factor A protein 1 [Saitozyma podzolica]
MASPLSVGFCEKVFHADETPEGEQPVLQILNVKKINAPGASGADRYRIILSDGQYFIQSMLATQLNDKVENKELDKHVVVKLTHFVLNAVQGRKLIIILDLNVQPWNGEKIGDPKNVEQHSTAPPAAAAAAAPAPAAPASRTTGAAPARTGSNNRSAGPGKDGMGPLYPIEGLSPYQNKWTIKARVTQKSDIKHWSNQRGEGKLFSVTFMDETGEIRATGFNDAVDRFYELLQEGKVYFVSRARVNIAKKQFSNVNNEYEIMFENSTEIDPCDDDSVPQVKYNFKGIGELGDCQKDELCDVIGVVKEVHELGSVTSKATNKPFAKRDIQLVDQSGQSVRLTLWGKQAETFNHEDQPVIAFKGVKVGDFGGRSLSMFSSATMSVNPDIAEAHALRGWYDAEGQNKQFQAYTNSMATRSDNAAPRPSELKTIGQAKDEQLGMGEKTDYFTTQATIAFIKNETFSYPACANPEGCNKKVLDNGDGWLCEKCDRKWDSPIHRYILSLNVLDHTSSFWITAFNEVAEQIMGVSANELMRLKEEGNDPEFSKYFQSAAAKTWTFQMMAKQDSYNDQVRVRYQCRRAGPPDYPNDSAYLAQMISQMAF